MVPKKFLFFNTAAVARPFPHLQRAALSAGGAFLRGALSAARSALSAGAQICAVR